MTILPPNPRSNDFDEAPASEVFRHHVVVPLAFFQVLVDAWAELRLLRKNGVVTAPPPPPVRSVEAKPSGDPLAHIMNHETGGGKGDWYVPGMQPQGHAKHMMEEEMKARQAPKKDTTSDGR